MENDNVSSTLSREIMQRLPRAVASIGVATALDGDVSFTSSVGWWNAGWKLISAMIAYESLGYAHRNAPRGDSGIVSQLGAHLRGQRLIAHLAEKGFAAYAVHEALGATVYRDQPVDVRAMFYTTLGMYGIMLFGKLRN